MADKAILFDATKCMACRACQVACKQWNDLKAEETTNRGSYENPPDLSANTWVKIKFTEMEQGGKLKWLFTRRACMHCTDAACVKVCPPHALYHDTRGMVSYNKDLCTGCGYCADACPFEVPQSTRNLITGIAKMDKCTMCTSYGLDRVAEGWQPACVKTCPPEALVFGDRDQLLMQGQKKVTALKSNGNNNAYLYGEKELGGLHVLYVLDDSPDVYGLPVNPQVSAATIVWKDVLQPMGWAVGGLAIVGLALNFMVAREAKMTHDLPGKKKEK